MNKFYITNGITQDGFGARLQRCFQVMCYVYELQSQGIPVEYIHTSLSYNQNTLINQDRSIGEIVRSNFSLANSYPYNDISEEGYNVRAKLWDNFLKYKGKTVFNIDLTTVEIQEATYSLITNFINREGSTGSTVLYVLRYLHNEYDAGEININLFDKHRGKILKNFNLSQRKKTEKPQVAVHIRRKDILDKSQRYLDDNYYVTILTALARLKDRYEVTIYSQEIGLNLETYKDWKVVLDTDQEDFITFKKLVQADYLITSKSSFSYTAALLNKNTVIHHFTGHISLNGWITADNYINLLNTI